MVGAVAWSHLLPRFYSKRAEPVALTFNGAVGLDRDTGIAYLNALSAH